MPNILTAAEAATVLRCDTADPDMLNLLPLVDEFIQGATGRDWAADATIHDRAKSVARMLLVAWHENPSQVGQADTPGYGITATLAQLEVLALRYRTFSGRSGLGSIPLLGSEPGDTVSSLTGVIGSSGDQRAAFEAVITVRDEIQQVSDSDLSSNYYRAFLTPVAYL